MPFKPTKEQEAAIKAKGTLLVSAAAGSGKTAVLVERVIDMITDPDNPVDADSLLVVTFTNAAAAEMRSRIAARVAEEIHKAPNNKRLQRQQILITKADISTIDSFCINLVKENFYKLDLPPDFKVADEGLLNQLKAKAMDEMVDECFETESAEFRELLSVLGADGSDKNFCDAVERIYSFLRSLPFPDEWMQKAAEMYENTGDFEKSEWAETIFKFTEGLVLAAVREFKPTLDEMAGDEQIYAAYGDAYNNTLNSLEMLLHYIESRDWDNTQNLILNYKPQKTGTLRKYEDTEFKNKCKASRDSANEVFVSLGKYFCASSEDAAADIKRLAPLVKLLFEKVKIYSDKLGKLKAEKKCLDFSDIEYAALRLLTEKKDGKIIYTDIAKELHSRYSEVLVDEYQDTNDLQDTIFSAVSNGGEKLFMVGDVKQSIYRFRQANPYNFLRRKSEYKPYDGSTGKTKITLSSNFRSRAGVCDFVNFVFRLIMSRETGEMDYSQDEELIPAAVFPETDTPHTELHIIETAGCDDKREITEARHIADYIKQTMGSGNVIRDGEALRPAKFRDFTILLRNGKKAAVYRKELKAAEIPVWIDSTGGLLEAPETVTIISLLRVIDNPLRDVPLLNVLLSPIFGFTPDELAEIRAEDRKASLFAALYSYRNKSKKAEAFLKSLDKMRMEAATEPTDELLRRLYDETGYLSLVQAYEDGPQKRANLLLLLEYARSFENAGFKGLSGFLRYIDKMGNTTLNTASIVTEADDVVRIMTIHRSKGLQFPICILAGLSFQLNKSDTTAPILLNEDSGIGLLMYDDNLRAKFTTLPRAAIAVKTEKAAISEELRVLYVAMTRAEDRLILVTSVKNTENELKNLALKVKNGYIDPVNVLKTANYSELLLSCALLHKSGDILRKMAGLDIKPLESEYDFKADLIYGAEILKSENKNVTEPAKADSIILNEIEKRLSFKYPYEDLNGIAAKMSASYIAKRETDEEYYCTDRPAFLSEDSLTPAEKGTATHAFLQYADFAAAEKDINAELVRLVEEEFLSEPQMRAVDVSRLRRFFESKLYSRMKLAECLYCEYKFMVELPAHEVDGNFPKELENEKIVIQGIADCVFFENGEPVIVDYKTDRVKNIKILAEHYAPQLKIYAKALSLVFGKDVKSALIYSLQLGESIEIV